MDKPFDLKRTIRFLTIVHRKLGEKRGVAALTPEEEAYYQRLDLAMVEEIPRVRAALGMDRSAAP